MMIVTETMHRYGIEVLFQFEGALKVFDGSALPKSIQLSVYGSVAEQDKG